MPCYNIGICEAASNTRGKIESDTFFIIDNKGWGHKPDSIIKHGIPVGYDQLR